MHDLTDDGGTMRLEINVHGAEVAVDALLDKPLWIVCNQAFGAAGLTGQPLENWEMRDQDGRLLFLTACVGDFAFTDSTRLSLNPKPAIGG